MDDNVRIVKTIRKWVHRVPLKGKEKYVGRNNRRERRICCFSPVCDTFSEFRVTTFPFEIPSLAFPFTPFTTQTQLRICDFRFGVTLEQAEY